MEPRPDFNFDLVTDRFGYVIRHPDNLVGTEARRPSTFFDDAYTIITEAPANDLDWYGHFEKTPDELSFGKNNVYQRVLNVTLAALAVKYNPIANVPDRLSNWQRAHPNEAAARLNTESLTAAHRYALETIDPKLAAKMGAYMLPRIVDLHGLANIIENHVSNTNVTEADPEATADLILYGEERSSEDTEGNLSYVLANYISSPVAQELRSRRFDWICRRAAERIQQLQNPQEILKYRPTHPEASINRQLSYALLTMRYGKLLADVPHEELSHRYKYEAALNDQSDSYLRERIESYQNILGEKTILHKAMSAHVQELAQRNPEELQLDLLNKKYYADVLDQVLFYQYCVANPGSHELPIFRALIETIPSRLFSENLDEDRAASQEVLKHFYDPDKPEASYITPPVKIKLPVNVSYKILG